MLQLGELSIYHGSLVYTSDGARINAWRDAGSNTLTLGSLTWPAPDPDFVGVAALSNISPADPNNVLVAVHGKGVYRWGAKPGLPILVHMSETS